MALWRYAHVVPVNLGGCVMSKETVVTSLPNCDICVVKRNPPTEAYADCYIPSYGTWGNVCHNHFHIEGCQLGTGVGQLFRIEAQTDKPPLSQTERIKQNLAEAFEDAGNDGIPFDVLEELFEDRDPSEFL